MDPFPKKSSSIIHFISHELYFYFLMHINCFGCQNTTLDHCVPLYLQEFWSRGPRNSQILKFVLKPCFLRLERLFFNWSLFSFEIFLIHFRPFDSDEFYRFQRISSWSLFIVIFIPSWKRNFIMAISTFSSHTSKHVQTPDSQDTYLSGCVVFWQLFVANMALLISYH